MFKDLTYLADPNETEITSIHRQAYLHGELKSLLEVMNSQLQINDLEQLKEAALSNVEKAFEYNCNESPTQVELNKLINKKDKYYSRVYRFTKEYEIPNRIIIHSKFKELQFDLSRSITTLISCLAKKEKYIEYVLSDNENNQEEVKLKDTVVYANDKLHNVLANADTYNLKYESSNEREGKLGFIKQVKGYTDKGIKFTPEIIVDFNWCKKVWDTGLTILEYQGARAFTISCEFLRDGNDCKLYSTKVLQIRGTREEKNIASYHSYYSNTNWDAIGALFKVKDLVLAIPNNGISNTGYLYNSPHMALGQDEEWAERTMRRRQKIDMMKQLNL